MSEPVPKLRTDIEVIPTQYQGQKAFVIRDALGLIPEPVLLQGEALRFIQLLDGRRDLRDIQLEVMRSQSNTFISTEVIEKFISDLDAAFLLDSEHYRSEKDRIIHDYARLEIRKAALQGSAYPEDPQQLRSYLDDFFSDSHSAETCGFKGQIQGLIAPHIDLEAGKSVYTQAYQAVRDLKPGRVLLLGTGHSLQSHYFSLTTKDFETPLGIVKTSAADVEKLKKAGGELISTHDITHRKEHSLEFQLLFLQYLWGESFSLVPVLCGSLHTELEAVARPAEIPGMPTLLEAMTRLINEEPFTLIVAGVDFSHIGLKFGHPAPALSMLEGATSHDHRLIETICRGDVRGFWEEVRRVQDKYNICGFSTMALLLELLAPAQGCLLAYDFWQEEATHSAVSFAAMVLGRCK